MLNYDAQQNRYKKDNFIIEENLLSRITTEKHDVNYYIRDAQGNVLAIYSKQHNCTINTETGTLSQQSYQLTQKEQHLYGSSRLGIVQLERPMSAMSFHASDLVTQNQGARQYELTNHLGNVLSTLTDKGVITSAQDYFPFGLTLASRSFTEGGSAYRYSFNGKEDDKETGLQDYGMRLYFKQLGRFPTVDPLTKKYPFYSPYQFAGNMPIKYIDLDGAEPAEAPTSASTYTIAPKQGTSETYGWTPMIDKAKKALVWAQGDRVDFNLGAINEANTGTGTDRNPTTNTGGDLDFGDSPPYASIEARLKDATYSNQHLENNMRDALDFGAGGTGVFMSNHFINGGGTILPFGTETELSRQASQDTRFTAFANAFENNVQSYFETHGTLNGIGQANFNPDTGVPGVNPTGIRLGPVTAPMFNFSGITTNSLLATAIGGIQEIRMTVQSVNIVNGRVHGTFLYNIRDSFGAGNTDGNRSMFPGLISMYVLQHYRNATENRNNYRPFVSDIYITRTR